MTKILYRSLFFSLLIWVGISTQAQTRKLTANLIGGAGFIPGNESFNDYGQAQKLFPGNKPGLYAELGVYYHFKKQLFLGLAGNYFGTTKPNYTLGANGLHVRGGFVFVHNPKHVWPYAYVGAGVSNVKIVRSFYHQQYTATTQDFESTDLVVNDLTSTYGSAQFNENAFNVEGGVGLDIIVYRRWSLNLQLGLNYYFLSQKQFLKDNFFQGSENLPLFTGTGGVSYTIAYRNKKQNINSVIVKNDHKGSHVAYHKKNKKSASNKKAIAAAPEKAENSTLAKPATGEAQKASSKPGYLSEIKNSHTIEKEKLAPGKKISVLGKVHGPNSSTANIIVTDKKGNVVKKTNAKNGHFAYTNLNPDDYEVKFEKPDPKLTMEVKTVEDEGMMKVSAEDFKKHNFKKLANDPAGNMVQGRLKNVSANQYENSDLNILLVNDKDEVVSKTTANKEGYFAFGKLNQDNYTAIVESPDKNIKAEIKVAENDPAMRLSGQELKGYHYVALNQNLDDGTIVTGRVTINAGTKAAADESILIVDSKGNVRQTTTNAQGYFAFKNLENEDHQILLEKPDPGITVVAHPVADVSNLIVPSDNLLKHNYNTLKGDNVANNVLTGSLNITDHLKPVDQLDILLLNDEGKVIQSTKPNAKGQFAFKDLAADNYKAVVSSPEVRLMANLHAPVNDPGLIVDNNGLTKFNTATNKYDKLKPDEQLSFSGKITEHATSKPLEDHTVFLLDEKGSVADVAQTDKEGAFFFGAKAQQNYQVVFEGKEDKMYASELDVYANKNKSVSTGAGKNGVTIHYKKGNMAADDGDTSKINRFIRHYRNNTAQPKVKLRVFTGSMDDNKKLHELDIKRATEIRKKLIGQGVPPESIVIEDIGIPVKSQNKAGKEKESRVEIVIE